MVETITPVVHGGRRRRWLGMVGVHAVGAAAVAAGVGALFGAIGRLAGAPWEGAGRWAVAGVAVVYAAREAGLPVPLPEVRRQVPEWWRRSFSPWMASFLYGLMLGVGYLTHLGHGTWVVVSLAAAASGDPLLGAAVAAPFGLARAVSLVVVARARRPGDVSTVIDQLESMAGARADRVANAAVLVGVAVVATAGVRPEVRPLAEAGVVVLAVVFAWAALAKVLLPSRWRRVLAAHPLPAWMRRAAGPGVPVAELAVPVLVLLGRPREAAAVAAVLLVAFSGFVVWARGRRGGRLPCGCFGRIKSRDWRALLARNAALLVVAAVAATISAGPSLVDVARGPVPGEVLPAALTAVGLGLALWLVRRSLRLLDRAG
jgi:hypothetical protein